MSSMPRPDGRSIGYYCRAAHNNTSHPRPYVVSERFIRPWAVVKIAESYVAAATTFEDEPDPGAMAERMAELDAKRERIVDMFADGTLDKPERNKRLTAIEADRTRLASAAVTGRKVREFRIAPFDWSRDPGVVNADLRDLWDHIELGADLRPVRAVWRPCEEWGEEGPRGNA